MKKWITLCVVIIVAVITNPKKDEHIDAVKKKISQAALSEAVEDARSGDDFKQAGAVLGMTLGMTLIDNVVKSVLEVDNYVLFSLTKFSYAGKEKVVGFGVFGNVWLFGDLKGSVSDLRK